MKGKTLTGILIGGLLISNLHAGEVPEICNLGEESPMTYMLNGEKNNLREKAENGVVYKITPSSEGFEEFKRCVNSEDEAIPEHILENKVSAYGLSARKSNNCSEELENYEYIKNSNDDRYVNVVRRGPSKDSIDVCLAVVLYKNKD